MQGSLSVANDVISDALGAINDYLLDKGPAVYEFSTPCVFESGERIVRIVVCEASDESDESSCFRVEWGADIFLCGPDDKVKVAFKDMPMPTLFAVLEPFLRERFPELDL